MTGELKLGAALGVPFDQTHQALRAGDDAAFEGLVAAHQKRVFGRALRLLGDAEEAATATQDCFLRAFRAASRCPQDTEGQQRWLIRMVTNLCLDRLRSRKWRWWRRMGLEKRAPGEEAASAASPVRTPERELLGKELASKLARALEQLPPRQKAVFVLRHYEDYRLEQIAEELALNVGTVKSHLSRALVRLRGELKDFYGTHSSGS